MTADEFRERLDRLGLSRQEAADRLGLSLQGLFHQMRGDRAVSRQTELLLEHLEHEQAQRRRQRRNRKLPVAGALVLAALFTATVGWAGDRPFDWDRYHARQDACSEKDRIVAECALPGVQ